MTTAEDIIEPEGAAPSPEAAEVAACPSCKAAAEGEEEIGAAFGFRKMKHVTKDGVEKIVKRRQSHCRACRSAEAKLRRLGFTDVASAGKRRKIGKKKVEAARLERAAERAAAREAAKTEAVEEKRAAERAAAREAAKTEAVEEKRAELGRKPKAELVELAADKGITVEGRATKAKLVEALMAPPPAPVKPKRPKAPKKPQKAPSKRTRKKRPAPVVEVKTDEEKAADADATEEEAAADPRQVFAAFVEEGSKRALMTKAKEWEIPRYTRMTETELAAALMKAWDARNPPKEEG